MRTARGSRASKPPNCLQVNVTSNVRYSSGTSTFCTRSNSSANALMTPMHLAPFILIVVWLWYEEEWVLDFAMRHRFGSERFFFIFLVGFLESVTFQKSRQNYYSGNQNVLTTRRYISCFRVAKNSIHYKLIMWPSVSVARSFDRCACAILCATLKRVKSFSFLSLCS